jgi:Protein of unknown function (DUF5818)
MKTMKRNLTKGLLPALFLTAALSMPAASVAAPVPHGKAQAADKVKNHNHKNQFRQARQNARQAERQTVKAQRQAVKARRQAVKAQQQIVVRRAAPRRVVVVQPQRVIVPRGRVVAVPQRVIVPRNRVVSQPIYVARGRNRWNGWNNRSSYSRYGSGMFQLQGTFIGQQYGCALVQDRSGQVIPLLNNPGDLRKGDYLVLSGRIQNSSVCGTAFRVYNVDQINGGDYYGSRDRNGYNDRYNNGYDDRYDRSGNRNLISITGRLDDSGRCPVIRGDRGEYYDLVGDLRDFHDGEHARVIGFADVRSRCGGPAIEVQEID